MGTRWAFWLRAPRARITRTPRNAPTAISAPATIAYVSIMRSCLPGGLKPPALVIVLDLVAAGSGYDHSNWQDSSEATCKTHKFYSQNKYLVLRCAAVRLVIAPVVGLATACRAAG